LKLTQAVQSGELTTSYVPPAPVPSGPFPALTIEGWQVPIISVIQPFHAAFTAPGQLIAVPILSCDQGHNKDCKPEK